MRSLIYAVDDEASDNADADWQERDKDTDRDVPENDLGTRLPNQVKNGRNIFECP